MRENGQDAVMPVIALGRCLNDPNLFGPPFPRRELGGVEGVSGGIVC